MNKPLNILMICHKSPLGAYARSHVMGANLVKRGHKVTLLMISEKDHWRTIEYDWDGVRGIVAPQFGPGRLKYGWDIWNTIARILFLNQEKQSYDLIHCYETRPATIYPALWFSRKRHVPIVTDWNDWFGRDGLVEVNRPEWYHKLNLRGIETYYEEAFRAKAAGLTVISSALLERAIKLGVRPERICHLPGGTFLDWFKLRSKEECRTRLGFPLEIPILAFGSSDSHFDMEIVIAALAKVSQEFPAIKLIITGKAKENIHQMVKAFGVQDHVSFTGYVSFEDLPWYLGCADLFLLPMADRPYNKGRWPNKLGEYMSLGRPTVANPVGDVTSVFENHTIGLLAEWDPQDFADKITSILRNPGLAEKLGRNARMLAETEYDWRILIERLETFYYKILNAGSNHER